MTQLVEAATRLLQKSGFESMSMQQLADEASVSIGLIYRYFSNKEEVLVAIIQDVLSAFAEKVPAAIMGAGPDPVEQVAAGFRAYCEIIDDRRHAAVLTYQESRTLSDGSLKEIQGEEIATTKLLENPLAAGVASGAFVEIDTESVAYNLVLLAHAWALKHWYFAGQKDLDGYVREQTAFVLRSILAPQRHEEYAHLLRPGRG